MHALQTDRHAAVFALEDALCAMPQTDLPLRHYFADGMYAREMTIPADVVATGAIHKTRHLCVISQGTISALTDDGVKTMSAPCTFISEAGTKRAVSAPTETVLTTFHATTETDLDKLVEELSYSTASNLIGGKHNKQIVVNRLLEVVK